MAKTLKIVIFHCAFVYSGGGERIVLEQIRELKKRGYQVECYAPVIDRENCYPELIGGFDIKPFFIDLPRWFPFRIVILMLLSCFVAPFLAFKFKDTDVIIGENQPGVWLAFCVAKVLRKDYLVYLCHPNRMVYSRDLSKRELWQAVPDFFYLSYLIDIFKYLVKFLDNISINGGKTILTNGYFIQKEIKKIHKKKCVACPAGTNVYPKSQAIKAFAIRESGQFKINGYKLDKPYILFTGRHEVWKRIDWAIKMMKRVVGGFPDVRLVIPGVENHWTRRLKRLTQQLKLEDKVYFLGTINQKQLWRLYLYATVFVFPSSLEDFGIVVLEAMSRAVPVVAWNIGGPVDTVVNKKTGYLVEPYNFKKFSRAIVRVLKNRKLQTKLGMAGRERVKNEFSWEKHLDVLEEAVGKALKISNY